MGHRPTLVNDTRDEQPPAVDGQPGITVGHGDLRFRVGVSTSHLAGGLASSQAATPSTTLMGIT
ncbi:hypothetical protein, partial [Micromonospora aurantiaca (nom. illeg.)]|uniref:hypothetical protein n=1 Tax=Micromonospora aurantiaca (nom. illeg.) TaxID=47850 RepID=UPI0038114DC5